MNKVKKNNDFVVKDVIKGTKLFNPLNRKKLNKDDLDDLMTEEE